MTARVLDQNASIKERAAADWDRFLTWAMAQPLAKLAIIAALVMAVVDIWFDPSRLTIALGDTDDATRLTEVRQLIAGQSWFDMSMPRFGGSEVLVSHWSRLFDLPLAAMILALSPFIGQEWAEFVTRMAWPTLLSCVIIYMVARYTLSVSSRITALLALVLAAAAMGHFQFAPGRIDHHSGMIIGAIGGTFALLWAIDRPRLGWIAGVLFGTGVAIGYEGLGLTIAALTLVTLSSIVRNQSLAGIARAAVAFAAVLAMAYPVFGPFRSDLYVVCDALSTNLIAMAVSAAFGVGLAHMARSQGASIPVTFGFVAAFGAAGIVLYGVTNPVCLGGPYADLDPRLSPIWLNLVGEVQSAASYYKTSILDLRPFIIYLAAVVYGVILVRGGRLRHAELFFAIYLVTMVLGLWQIRLLPYASFLAAPLIALGLHRPAAAKSATGQPLKLPTLSSLAALSKPQLAGVALAGLVTVGAGVAVLASGPNAAPVPVAGGMPVTEPIDVKAYSDCTSKDAMSPLSVIGNGLAANDIDLGPYVVAFTKLDVIAAPYHRMGRTILANHDLMFASASEAKLRMRQIGVQYLIVCKGAGSTIPAAKIPGDYLRGALLDGKAPDFLEQIVLANTPVKVWRLKAD